VRVPDVGAVRGRQPHQGLSGVAGAEHLSRARGRPLRARSRVEGQGRCRRADRVPEARRSRMIAGPTADGAWFYVVEPEGGRHAPEAGKTVTADGLVLTRRPHGYPARVEVVDA